MNTWTRGEREEFRRSGTLPTKAAPSPAKVESKPVAEAKPETKEAGTEAAKPEGEGEKPKAHGKLTAEERINQLESTIEKISKGAGVQSEKDRKIAELEGRIVELSKKSDGRAESSPAAEAPKAKALEFTKPKPTRPERDTYTKGGQLVYETLEAYEKAVDDYTEALTDWKLEKRDWEAEQKRQQEGFRKTYQETLDAHPGSEPNINAAAKAIFEDSTVPQIFSDTVGLSPVFAELLFTLSEGDTLAELIKTAKTNPRQALSVLFDVEKDVQKAVSARRADAGKAPVIAASDKKVSTPETPKPAAPEPHKEQAQTRVPAPPADVTGGHGVSAVDPMKLAVQSGNMAKVKALMREQGILRGRGKF
jgi:hypothetical protein